MLWITSILPTLLMKDISRTIRSKLLYYETISTQYLDHCITFTCNELINQILAHVRLLTHSEHLSKNFERPENTWVCVRVLASSYGVDVHMNMMDSVNICQE